LNRCFPEINAPCTQVYVAHQIALLIQEEGGGHCGNLGQKIADHHHIWHQMEIIRLGILNDLLCQGNIIETVYSAAGREDRTYYKIMGREAVVEECLMHSDGDDSWYWSPTGDAAAFNWTEMSQEAYNAVREKYPYIQDTLEWKPITEYPSVSSELTSRLFENLFLPLAGGEYLNGREQFAEAIEKQGYESYVSEGILYVDDPENPDCFLSGVLSNRYGFEEIYELTYCYVNHCAVKFTFEDREAPQFFTAPDLLTEPTRVESLEELIEYFYHS